MSDLRRRPPTPHGDRRRVCRCAIGLRHRRSPAPEARSPWVYRDVQCRPESPTGGPGMALHWSASQLTRFRPNIADDRGDHRLTKSIVCNGTACAAFPPALRQPCRVPVPHRRHHRRDSAAPATARRCSTTGTGRVAASASTPHSTAQGPIGPNGIVVIAFTPQPPHGAQRQREHLDRTYPVAARLHDPRRFDLHHAVRLHAAGTRWTHYRHGRRRPVHCRARSSQDLFAPLVAGNAVLHQHHEPRNAQGNSTCPDPGTRAICASGVAGRRPACIRTPTMPRRSYRWTEPRRDAGDAFIFGVLHASPPPCAPFTHSVFLTNRFRVLSIVACCLGVALAIVFAPSADAADAFERRARQKSRGPC